MSRLLPLALALLTSPQAPPGDAGTLIVTNMTDNTATLVDVGSMTPRATVKTGAGPHEAAVSHDGRWAVVTTYGVRGAPGNSIVVIDVARGAVTRTIDLGEYRRPHAVAFLPGDSMLVVTSEASRAVVLVDFRSGTVAGTVPTGRPASHMLALSPDGSALFTTNVGDGSITPIDPVSRTADSVIPVARLVEGLTISPDGREVWVGSNGDSIVVVVDVARRVPVDTLRGFGMPYRLAATPDGRRIVISDPIRGQVRIVDRRTRKVEHVIQVPGDGVLETAEVKGSPSPEGVAVSRDSRFAYVTLQGKNQVAQIELATGRILSTAPTGSWPDGIAYSPVAGR